MQRIILPKNYNESLIESLKTNSLYKRHGGYLPLEDGRDGQGTFKEVNRIDLLDAVRVW